MRRKKFVIPAIAGIVALIGAGVAFAYFTSSGTGVGSAKVGTPSALNISQIGSIYDSTLSPLPGDTPASEAFEATGTSAIGNQISLASVAQPLTNVVVTMSSWACESGAWNSDCVGSPSDTYPVPITLTLYNTGSGGLPGTTIVTDQQTFNIPYRPSSSASCTGANAGAWISNGTCYFGYANNITFDFSSQDVILPSTVIYEISYDTNYNDHSVLASAPVNSLNVGVSDDTGKPATTDVTVGSDAITGDFLASAEPVSYCSGAPADALGAFQYDPYTAPCSGGNAIDNPAPGQSGTWAVDYQPGFWVPAVQFNAGGQGVSALYPGATPLSVNFTVTNPGNTPVPITSVTFSITNIAGGNDSTPGLDGSCPASWFNLVQPTSPASVTIDAGQTLTYDPSGGSIQLANEPGNQDACEGATVTLGFTSN